jgi:hypothetical protein
VTHGRFKVEIAGIEISADFVLDALRSAAKQGVPAVQFAGDGLGWANEIACAIGNREPLRTALRSAISALLRGTPDEVALVARGILDTRPDLAAGSDIVSALRRTDLVSGVRIALATALDQLIKRGDFRYSDDLREFAQSPDTELSLIGTYLVDDHSWYIERLRSLPLELATERIIQASLGLTKAELLALRNELAEDKRGAAIVEWLDREAASELAEAQTLPTRVRWRRK